MAHKNISLYMYRAINKVNIFIHYSFFDLLFVVVFKLQRRKILLGVG